MSVQIEEIKFHRNNKCFYGFEQWHVVSMSIVEEIMRFSSEKETSELARIMDISAFALPSRFCSQALGGKYPLVQNAKSVFIN